jgi:hypothetical protein
VKEGRSDEVVVRRIQKRKEETILVLIITIIIIAKIIASDNLNHIPPLGTRKEDTLASLACGLSHAEVGFGRMNPH